MNTRALKMLAAAVVLTGGAACTDVTTEPQSTVSSTNIFNDPSSYRAFLAKLYAGLAVTGQEGPHGAADIEGIDEGFSQYIRGLWQLQELPTDEAVIGWGDESLPELNTQQWGAANRFTGAFYYRIFYQVALANEFLRETTEAKLAERGVRAAVRDNVQQYRAEARFLRALSYWHALDLFGSVPLVTENDARGAAPPEQATREDLFAFVESELKAIQGELPGPGAAQYGRVDQGAVAMVLAKLYLNAGVYTGQNRNADVITALQPVLSGPYALDDEYLEIFLADNHASPEIIFAVPFDGQHTRTWGGTTFLAHAAVGGNMDASDYGLDWGWWGLRVTPELVTLFPEGADGPDGRSEIFVTDGHSLEIGSISNFFDGYAAPKYQNVTSTGQPGSHPTFPDTDYPMFRLADAYLMYAEAVLRGGGGSQAQALAYVNELRERAYGDESGNISASELTLDFILEERARELFWEGHRRTDLVRFDRFTQNGVWAWKGGTQQGRPTEPFRALYPLPASELLANPNLEQNPGY